MARSVVVKRASHILNCFSLRPLFHHTPNRLVRDLKKLQYGDLADETKEPELASLGQVSSHLSHALATRDGDGDGSYALGAERDVEMGGFNALARGGGWGAARNDDSVGSSSDSSSDSSDKRPFTFEELQERTQAARAAVNILLPNRVDDMAGRDGPYGLRRRDQGRGRR